jgi:Bacterial Ig domain/Cytochrome c554 and c-prime
MKTTRASLRRPLAGFFLVFLTTTGPTPAKPEIRDAFFLVYPSANNTQLDDLPSKSTHCLVCHYKASGGGTKNPYGEAIKTFGNLNQPAGRIAAVNGVANADSDNDAYNSGNEVTATGYSNTPTFPGLSSANYSLVNGVPASEVLDYLTPKTTVDNTPPQVAVLTPNGGETLTGNQAYNVTWTASDASGIVAIHIYQSIDGGLNYTPVIYGLENTGTYSWTPANRPTTSAKIKVVAVDGAININNDVSNSVFTVISPPGGKVPTTLRDFDMPGTQPFEAGSEPDPPENCAQCHGGYDPAVEPYANWQGSMMAHASRDPLFEANMVIANQDAPDSGDLCLRCHDSSGWMQGRSVPTDGSAMLERDKIGVSCDLCHRMVDPVYKVDLSPARDQQVLADLSFPGTQYGNGMFVLDPDGIVRGPFDDAAAPHAFRASPFHKSSAFCGTCHDVSNPAFTKDQNGIYQPNTFDLTAGEVSPHSSGPVERTYSEWLNSEYATTGVHQPEFAGNKPGDMVFTCQDCHMRDVNAKGCNVAGAPTRPDMPLHDMTGGSTWVPQMIANMYPDKVNVAAIQAGIERARYMLQNSADLAVMVESGKLKATVTNQTGHKLPTGYPEGRRIWLNVKFYNTENQLISESGAYDAATGVLSHDPEAKIYEVHPGIGENIAGVVGLPAGPSLHFVLNNKIFEDNRIPPRGFTNAAFAQFGGAPVGHTYADGQHWDDTEYAIPAAATRAEVRLFYQSTSKEFIEFLRDKNVTNNKGTILYNLWNDNGKCPPELMVQAQWTIDPAADDDRDGMANAVEQEYDMNPFDAADALLDADNDGLSNLVESALASDPTDAGSTHRPEGVWVDVASPAGRHFAVRYVRRVPNPNAAIVVETSDDLVNWQSGVLQTTTHEVINHLDGTETVIERMLEPSTGVPASFMRVKVLPAGAP